MVPVAQLDAVTVVKYEDLENQLALIQASCGDSTVGLFGPSSVTWSVEREAALFLGAGRALLLQLAHPWIAAAIADRPHTMMDPIGRFHRTFSIMFTMVFGTLDQALGAARRLHQRHAQITGALTKGAGPFPSGTHYFANEVSALRWVWATLTETALLAHDLVLPPLSAGERERYYAESKLSAGLFGISHAALPSDWTAFMVYNERMWRSDILTVTPAACAIASQVLGDTLWPRIPPWYGRLTAGILPPPARDAFGLRYGLAEHVAAERALRWIRRIHRLLPERLRYVGPYYEALGRLSGRSRPDVITQASNKMWIGHRRLM